MSLRELSVQLLNILVQIIIVFVGTFALKYLQYAKAQLQNKMGKEFYDFAYSTVKILVQAIEQTSPNLSGDKKYGLVFRKINEKFGNSLTDEEINELIESAVQEMNYVKKATNNSL